MLPVILIGIGALLCVQACVQDPKVSVDVFYETYCPDSRSFVLDQLNSTYAELSSIIKLQLVPYGKASRRELPNGWYSFDCQHGDKECYGNLLQSCVIKYYPEPKEHLPLVVCMFASNNPNRAYESCARKQGFNLENLQKCVSGKEGNDLQLHYAELTEGVNSRKRLEFVPWIRFNGVNAKSELLYCGSARITKSTFEHKLACSGLHSKSMAAVMGTVPKGLVHERFLLERRHIFSPLGIFISAQLLLT